MRGLLLLLLAAAACGSPPAVTCEPHACADPPYFWVDAVVQGRVTDICIGGAELTFRVDGAGPTRSRPWRAGSLHDPCAQRYTEPRGWWPYP